MKEPFVDLNSLIDQTTILADMELQAYLASMGKNQKNDFIASNVTDAIDNVKAAKSRRFADMADQVAGADNNITSAEYYLARTSDLLNLTGDVDDVAIKQLSTSDINKDLAGRQYEINEWANFNKLDTLYFLQVLFIVLTFNSFILFLKFNGLVSSSLFAMMAVISGLVAVFALVMRARYTAVMRDSRYWHKARFPKQENPFPTPVTVSTGICPT